MKVYDEEDYLMISGIQHFTFCRRQWALIHIENLWEDNVRTVEGNIMHTRAHGGPTKESRKDKVISREMRVFSHELGITGICDVVEFSRCEDGDMAGVTLYGREGKYRVTPVEYKKGEPKVNDADRMQLIAQIICLEEMMAAKIEYGYLYYGETKRREKVEADERLRNDFAKVVAEMHDLFDKKHTPKVKWSKSCNACSLKDLCVPKLLKNKNVHNYIKSRIEEDV